MGWKSGHFCVFSKETHRCIRVRDCGHWERGYAPKKENVKQKARVECQICGLKWAIVENGKIGHHGYTRPGTGFIEGDCFGVGYLPYPNTDALKKWLDIIINQCKNYLDYIKKIPTLEIFITWTIRGIREIKKSDFDDYTWNRYLNTEKGNIEVKIKHTKREICRVAERIKKADNE